MQYCASLHMCLVLTGIRQANMSESLGLIDILCGNLHQDHPQCRLISNVHKVHFGATIKPLFQLLQP
jgi:hypothetical protein